MFGLSQANCQAQPQSQLQPNWALFSQPNYPSYTIHPPRIVVSTCFSLVCLWLVHSLFMSQLVHNLFTICSWLVHDLFTTCSQIVHDQFIPTFHNYFATFFQLFRFCSQLFIIFKNCSWLVHDLSITFFGLVIHFLTTFGDDLFITSFHNFFTTCSWLLQKLFLSTTLLWLVQNLFTTWSMPIHDLLFQILLIFFLTCSQLVNELFTTFLQYFPNLFMPCSLLVHGFNNFFTTFWQFFKTSSWLDST